MGPAVDAEMVSTVAFTGLTGSGLTGSGLTSSGLTGSGLTSGLTGFGEPVLVSIGAGACSSFPKPKNCPNLFKPASISFALYLGPF